MSTGRPLVLGLAVVLALGTIVVVGLIADRNPGQLRLVTPIASPTDFASLLPSPTPSSSGSPSASPSPTPTDKLQYVSDDGIWELFYPKAWFGPDVAPAGDFTNYRSSPSEVGIPIKVDLVIDVYSAEKDGTLDDFLAVMCQEWTGQQNLECKKVEINGRTWAWALVYFDGQGAGEASMAVDMRTIANGTIYVAAGYAFGKSGHEPGIAQIREVFESLVLNV